MKGFIVGLALCCCALPIISPLHSGKTDGDGGHYDHGAGEYHYHHGYPAHQHPNGICPYGIQEENEEPYDCGKEGCDIPGRHGHLNKPSTTTTTGEVQKQQKSKDHSSTLDTILCCLCLVFAPSFIKFLFTKIKKGK